MNLIEFDNIFNNIQIFRKEILGIEKKKYSKFFKLGKLNQVN